MNAKLSEAIGALTQMSGVALRERYAELFGDATQVGNRAWLVRRIAWRLQAQAEGGLSERARRRAAELANEADLRYNPPPAQPTAHRRRCLVCRPLARCSPGSTRFAPWKSPCARGASSTRATSIRP